jgi:hypothetical protein
MVEGTEAEAEACLMVQGPACVRCVRRAGSPMSQVRTEIASSASEACCHCMALMSLVTCAGAMSVDACVGCGPGTYSMTAGTFPHSLWKDHVEFVRRGLMTIWDVTCRLAVV